MRLSPDITEKLNNYIGICTDSLLSEKKAQGKLCFLDVGCGDGLELQSLNNNALTLYGIDPAVKQTEKIGCNDEILILNGSAEAIPFESDFADIVLMQCVFSLCDPNAAAKEINRILKSGGFLIVSDIYTMQETCKIDSGTLLGNIYKKEMLESYFKHFRLNDFADLSEALTLMLINLIMSGKTEDCAFYNNRKKLKDVGARYGLWVFRKPRQT